ncbi:hypothetical protein BUE67_13490 [Corynebacterium diphtheriae]|nr:hypothetical protein BUE67_13490 [Corynebacterium diphtheriae]
MQRAYLVGDSEWIETTAQALAEIVGQNSSEDEASWGDTQPQVGLHFADPDRAEYLTAIEDSLRRIRRVFPVTSRAVR